MGFDSGTVSFRRFAVVGRAPREPSESMLKTLEEMAFAPGAGGAQEQEFGWSGGRHVLDTSFSFEHNVFGEALHFALRVDTNRVPAQMRRAYQMIEEEAAAAAGDKARKNMVKDAVRRRIEADLRNGRFRRSRLMPVLWDLPHATLYAAVSASAVEHLVSLFERTFELKLELLSAGRLAMRRAEASGGRRAYEDLRPALFAAAPPGEQRAPEYPWVPKGDFPKDYLGNEFLVWLWHQVEAHGGSVAHDGAEAAAMIDGLLEMHCVFGETGCDVLRASAPTRMPEAIDALRSGKVPRRAGLVVEAGSDQWQLVFSAETFACSGVRLPSAEQAVSPRAAFEQRIESLRDLCAALDGMFGAFLKERFSGAWEGRVAAMRRWTAQTAGRAGA